jgi:hypothetical protein
VVAWATERREGWAARVLLREKKKRGEMGQERGRKGRGLGPPGGREKKARGERGVRIGFCVFYLFLF